MNEPPSRRHAKRHMLSWLSDVCYEAREGASLRREDIASRGGVSYHMIYRFEEYADRWPRDIDALVGAYAKAVEVDPRLLWLQTVERSLQHGTPVSAGLAQIDEVPADVLRAVEQAIDAYAHDNEPGPTRSGRASRADGNPAPSSRRARS
jgi:hypothetical protein